MRVKCIAVRVFKGARPDPDLVLGRFYEVIDPRVDTIADETPYISVRDGTRELVRPRHLFGNFLHDYA